MSIDQLNRQRLSGVQDCSVRRQYVICFHFTETLSVRANMTPAEMATFVVQNIEPLADKIYGNRCRVAAHLIDGTYLPCVVLQSKEDQANLALRRFKDLRWKREQYRSVVEVFVSGGSRVAEYHLQNVEISPFAWPLEILRNIHGETTMGWTAFVAEMKDGTLYSYGTQFNFEFFDLPSGYLHSDIAKIHSGMIYSKPRGIENFSMPAAKEIQPLREKPFFTCYLKDLDSERKSN